MEKNTTSRFDVSNRLFLLLSVLLIGLLALFCVVAFISASKLFVSYKALPENTPREISVNAQGKAYMKADIAVIRLGATSEGKTVSTVVTDNNKKMSAITAELKKLNIEDHDIQTVNYNLTPSYEWPDGKRVLIGYSLTNEVQVKIRNFDNISAVITKATDSGANLINDLTFTIDNLETVRAEAREQAIAAAKVKAKNLAEQSGLRLVKIVGVWEDYTNDSLANRTYAYGMGGEKMVDEVSSASVSVGEQEVVVSVSLSYQVK